MHSRQLTCIFYVVYGRAVNSENSSVIVNKQRETINFRTEMPTEKEMFKPMSTHTREGAVLNSSIKVFHSYGSSKGSTLGCCPPNLHWGSMHSKAASAYLYRSRQSHRCPGSKAISISDYPTTLSSPPFPPYMALKGQQRGGKMARKKQSAGGLQLSFEPPTRHLWILTHSPSTQHLPSTCSVFP